MNSESVFRSFVTSAARHRYFLLLLGIYCAIVLPYLGHGVGTLDAHGIMYVVRHLVAGHGVEISRPPGHPTTEFYLFGSIAWLLRHGLGWEFSDKVYLTLQFLAGATGLILFYEMLRRLEVSSLRAALASICFAFSPQYLANSLDGEEFVFALVFVLLATRLLISSAGLGSAASNVRIYLSMLAFALATGCRPEAVIVGVIYPLFYYFNPRLTWTSVIPGLAVLGLAMVAVWWPVLAFRSVTPPTGSGMTFLQSILGAGYKVVFQFFTLPVFVLVAFSVFHGLVQSSSRLRLPFPKNFLFALSIVVTGFFAVFFMVRPDKPSYVLCVLPFVLLLVLNCSDWVLVGIAVFTIFSCFVGIDIFRERVIAFPHFTQGSFVRAISGKPYARLDYLRRVVLACEGSPTVIVTNAWPWDFSYHIDRGSLDLSEHSYATSNGGAIKGFCPPGNRTCIVLSRDGALDMNLLKKFHEDSYAIKMDRALYRTLFWKFNVKERLGDTATVDGLSLQLFDSAGQLVR